VPTSAFNEQKLNINFDFKIPSIGDILPVRAGIDFDIFNTVNSLYSKPKTTLQANMSKILWNGLAPQIEAQLAGSVINANPFCLNVSGINLGVTDSKGEVMASNVLPGISIAANSNYTFQTKTLLPINALNQAGLIASSDISASILYSLISFKGTAPMPVPRLKDLIANPQIILETGSTWIKGDPNSSLELLISTTINNDNVFDLTSGDLNIKIYDPKETLLGSASTPFKSIAGIPRLGTRVMSSKIILTSEQVGFTPFDAKISASIELGLENVYEGVPLRADTKYRVEPESW
jgi:hypothetical protein